MKKSIIGLGVALGLLFTATTGFAQEGEPDGTVHLWGGTPQAGGFYWGSGTLEYKGEKHDFSVKGLSVADHETENPDPTADGKVYSLGKLADFSGTYTPVTGGDTAAGGGSALRMKNEKGTLIVVVGTTKAVSLNLGSKGMSVELKD